VIGYRFKGLSYYYVSYPFQLMNLGCVLDRGWGNTGGIRRLVGTLFFQSNIVSQTLWKKLNWSF